MGLRFNRGYINNLNTKKKLLYAYFISVFIPVLIVGVILTYEMRAMALDNTVKAAYHDVERVRNKLDEVFRILITVSERIFIDKDIISLAEKKFLSDLQLTESIRSFTTFDQYLNYYSQLGNIRLFTENETFLNTGQFMKAQDVVDLQWYKNAVIRNGLISWEYMHDEMKDEYAIHLTRMVKDSLGNSVGVLTISMNRDYLYKYLKDETFDIYLIDGSGTVVAAKDYKLVGKTLGALELGKYIDLKNPGGDAVHGEIGGKFVRILSENYSPSKGDANFTIAAVFPTDQIAMEANRRSFLSIMIITASLAASLCLILVFTKALSRRITVLTGEIHKVAQGDLDTAITTAGRDEIGQLAQDIGVMIKSIKDLMYNAYEANLQKGQLELKQKEMQLKMLSSQVNPHFLFNTLETIRMKALEYRQKELSVKIKQLAGILRASLQMENKEITLAKEMELVRSYLEIQKYRFEDKISYMIECPEEYGSFKVPSFIVQPIVENSIIHGIERKHGSGEVKITVARDREKLIVSVADNGVGIKEERLKAILDSLADSQRGILEHIGIINVSHRIKLFYGQEYGLEIRTMQGAGTEVRMVLPVRGEEVV